MRLFYGTYDAESTAFKDLIPSWEATGVQVVPVYSSDGRGYVQDVFEKVSPRELLLCLGICMV